MCGVKITDWCTCSELRERLGVDDTITVVQQHTLRWYGHISTTDENDCVKKYMDYEVEGQKAGQRKTGVGLQKKIVISDKMQGSRYEKEKVN